MVDRCRNELYFKAKSRIFRVLVKTRVFLDLEIQVLFQNPDFDRFRSSRNLDPMSLNIQKISEIDDIFLR